MHEMERQSVKPQPGQKHRERSSVPGGAPLSQEGGPTDILASDAERAQVVDILQRAYVEGRLTLDEFTLRMEQAQQARTRGELEPIARDLPTPTPTTGTRPTIAYTAPKQAVTTSVAIMTEEKRRGRWTIGEQFNGVAVMGKLVLDLRDATLSAPVTTIDTFVMMGAIEVIVPEGVEVELNAVAIMAAKNDKIAGPTPPYGSPVIRINGFILMGELTVRDQPTFGERVSVKVRQLLE